MAWKTRGLRGSILEEMIGHVIEDYRKNGLALIQKVPTPITPIDIDKKTRHITLAYFDQKSTVDYIGVVQSIPVCFDAKECAKSTFPLTNIHDHQIEFMADFEKQGGISFLIIYFSTTGEFYYMRFEEMMNFVNRAKNGGRKSFTLDELDKNFYLGSSANTTINILRGIQRDLDLRDGDTDE